MKKRVRDMLDDFPVKFITDNKVATPAANNLLDNGGKPVSDAI